MTYNVASGDYVFNGHGLKAEEDYTLINFAREEGQWPATILILGDGIANGGGNVHIAESIVALLPDRTGDDITGAKIWLVLTEDIGDLESSTLDGWNPTEYLFEDDLIPLAP
jgi:hypothetical protein